jgi:ribulose 1,5-bisphosphate synthetase/thiazole synthase
LISNLNFGCRKHSRDIDLRQEITKYAGWQITAMQTYDAIIIGAGHNGLTSAAYL